MQKNKCVCIKSSANVAQKKRKELQKASVKKSQKIIVQSVKSVENEKNMQKTIAKTVQQRYI